MVQPAHNPNQLIVEGHDDLHSVVGLMRAHVDWPDGGPLNAPVYIKMGNGAEEILRKDGVLSVLLKAPTLRIAGVMLDADAKSKGRYESVRKLALSIFPNMPLDMPTEGLIVENPDGKRFGVWVMPDNAAEGSLETFLKFLVPDSESAIWQCAVSSVAAAKELGSAFHESHLEKAQLYTWLAWQNPPGQSPGLALTQKILDPHSDTAATFVAWFRGLYNLPPKANLFP